LYPIYVIKLIENMLVKAQNILTSPSKHNPEQWKAFAQEQSDSCDQT